MWCEAFSWQANNVVRTEQWDGNVLRGENLVHNWRRINIQCANNSTVQERPNWTKSMIPGNEERPGMIHVLYNVEMMPTAGWWWEHTSKVISSKVSPTGPHKNCPTPGYWWNHRSKYLLHNWDLLSGDWNHYTRWHGWLIYRFLTLWNWQTRHKI